MDLLSFERKLDSTIMRKKLEIQEALRRPMKQKRKLRVFIAHQFTTPEAGKVTGSLALGSTNADSLLRSILAPYFLSPLV